MNPEAASFDVSLGEYGGLPAWIIHTPLARAAISPHGGQLLSWQPTGQAEVLWLSANTRRAPQAIRGGVPVCWPYFGRQGQSGEVPQHGHARLSQWHWVDAAEGDDGAVIIDLALPADPRTALSLRQRLHIGSALQQTLITENHSQTPVEFTQALHSYFAVGDALRVRLQGVDGLRYEDKLAGGDHRQSGDWQLDAPATPGRADRIFATRGEPVALHDEAQGRWLHIESKGSRSLVVWNPGETGEATLPDVPAGSWREFVCVEVANAGDDAIVLAPGARHRLSQRISIADAAPRID